MKKKLLTLMVVLVAIFMGTATASAHDFVFEGIYYNILDDTSVEVTLCDTDKEYVGKVDVPSEVIGTDGTTYRVIGIGEEAFAYCYELEEVTLPQTLEIIKWDAFLECPMLNSIVIPASVATIENNVFGYCYGLSSIKVDAKNTVYDSRNNCNAIIETATNTLVAGCLSTNIPTTVEKLGDSSFFGIFCELEEPVEIAIPEGVTELGVDAFCGCTSLAKISLPSTLTKVGVSAFYGCPMLNSIVIPASVTTFESYVFMYCSSLKSVVVEEGNPVYDSRNNCNAIIETATNTLVAGCINTVIPTTVEKLGDTSFLGIFNGLEEPVEIAIPEGVTELGVDVFGYCESLAKISLPSTITGIGTNCFLECAGLEEIVCYDETPCVLIDDVFTAVPETAVLRIPAGTKDAYLANGWDSFPGTIVEDDTLTGVESVKTEENAPVEYYNLQGVKVACPENGMYIKKQGGRTSKVVL